VQQDDNAIAVTCGADGQLACDTARPGAGTAMSATTALATHRDLCALSSAVGL